MTYSPGAPPPILRKGRKKGTQRYTTNEIARHAYYRQRAAVLAGLGGKCVRCGFEDVRALQIDHVAGDGHLRRKIQYPASEYREILQRIQAEGDLSAWQLLCANCNWIKRAENGETR